MRGHVHGAPVPAVAGLQAGTRLHQPLRHAKVATIEGPQQGGVAPLTVFLRLSKIHLRPCLEQQFHMLLLPAMGREHEHGRTTVGQQIGVGALLQRLRQGLCISCVLGVDELGICGGPDAFHLWSTGSLLVPGGVPGQNPGIHHPCARQRCDQQAAPRRPGMLRCHRPLQPWREAALTVLPRTRDRLTYGTRSARAMHTRGEPGQLTLCIFGMHGVVVSLRGACAIRKKQFVDQGLAGSTGQLNPSRPEPRTSCHQQTIVQHAQSPAPGCSVQQPPQQHQQHQPGQHAPQALR